MYLRGAFREGIEHLRLDDALLPATLSTRLLLLLGLLGLLGRDSHHEEVLKEGSRSRQGGCRGTRGGIHSRHGAKVKRGM